MTSDQRARSWIKSEKLYFVSDIEEHLKFLRDTRILFDRSAKSTEEFRRLVSGEGEFLGSPEVALSEAVNHERHTLMNAAMYAQALSRNSIRIISELDEVIRRGIDLVSNMMTSESSLIKAFAEHERARKEYESRAQLENIPILERLERIVRDDSTLVFASNHLRQCQQTFRKYTHNWHTILSKLTEILDLPDPLPLDAWKNRNLVKVNGLIVFPNFRLWDPDDIYGAITVADVDQGSIGDCFFAATLAALAGKPAGRKLLMSLINDNHDGTFTVTFPGADPSKTPVSVHVDADFYVIDGNRPATTGYDRVYPKNYWYLVIEKAYAQTLDGSYGNLGKGGYGADVMRALGLKVRQAKVPSDGLFSNIEKCIRTESGFVTAYVDLHKLSSEYDKDALHAMTVLGYNKKSRTVILRNPWGTNFKVRSDLRKFTTGKPPTLIVRDDGMIEISEHLFEEMFYRVDFGSEG